MPGFEGPAAVFVASPTFHTPMGGGVIAFRDAAAAQRHALEHQGQVIPSLVELLRSEGANDHSTYDTRRRRSAGRRAGRSQHAAAALDADDGSSAVSEGPPSVRLRNSHDRRHAGAQHPQPLHRHAADRGPVVRDADVPDRHRGAGRALSVVTDPQMAAASRRRGDRGRPGDDPRRPAMAALRVRSHTQSNGARSDSRPSRRWSSGRHTWATSSRPE